ncbi:MAG: hypothetical protein ACE5JZ_02580 [Kiloniellales bacterium]
MSRIRKARASNMRLTHDRVIDIAGDLGDARIARILATGATVEDLEEAVAWAAGESDVMGEERLPLSGRVAKLYEILTADEDYADERD